MVDEFRRSAILADPLLPARSMADLMELGVDGIITDDPALAVRVRNELAAMSPVERLLLRFRKVILGGEATPPPAPAATTENRPTA